jgi:hypothetical protein
MAGAYIGSQSASCAKGNSSSSQSQTTRAATSRSWSPVDSRVAGDHLVRLPDAKAGAAVLYAYGGFNAPWVPPFPSNGMATIVEAYRTSFPKRLFFRVLRCSFLA